MDVKQHFNFNISASPPRRSAELHPPVQYGHLVLAKETHPTTRHLVFGDGGHKSEVSKANHNLRVVTELGSAGVGAVKMPQASKCRWGTVSEDRAEAGREGGGGDNNSDV